MWPEPTKGAIHPSTNQPSIQHLHWSRQHGTTVPNNLPVKYGLSKLVITSLSIPHALADIIYLALSYTQSPTSRPASCSQVELMQVLHHSTATISHANYLLPTHLFYAVTTNMYNIKTCKGWTSYVINIHRKSSSYQSLIKPLTTRLLINSSFPSYLVN